mmetsp:Transcript_100145/g.188658  ORF Transcript_100145/g.188658 Transcript_100145/m.188658 type:complete len:523 (-) Transcript_100145:164-1732(-)
MFLPGESMADETQETVVYENSLVKSPFTPGTTTIVERFSPYLCEFLGTFMVTLVFGFAYVNTARAHEAYGLALIILIYSFGSVSGGNFNPAVTLMLGMLGKITWYVCWLYIVFQFLGGLVASFAILSIFGYDIQVGYSAGYDVISAAIGEIFYTAMLCFVVANCEYSLRTNPKTDPNQFYAIAIGFAVIAGGYAIGPISGGFFNPAIAVGFGLLEGVLYTVYHCMGAALAAALFRALRPEDKGLDGSLLAEAVEPSWEARVLSEFVGTLAVAFTYGLTVVTGAGKMSAYAVGSVLLCMTYSLADVSGAHFNPAVSLAVWLCGRIKCRAQDMVIYAGIQILAAVIASSVFSFYHDSGAFADKIFGVAPKPFHSWEQVGFVETMFTFLICIVILSVATTSLTYPGHAAPPKKNFYFALAIGLSFMVALYTQQPVSRGAMNPALALGMSLEALSEQPGNFTNIIEVANTTSGVMMPISVETFTPDFMNFLHYWFYELLGAILAAVIFHITHAHEFYAKNEPAEQY